MIQFGAITIDVSHPKAFSDVLLKGDRARYTAVFNDGFREEDEVQAFAKQKDLKICTSLAELAACTDIGMIHSCNWDKHLEYARQFTALGKPVFIDKPIVGNLKDAEQMLLLAEGGARIFGSSALRYCYETQALRQRLAKSEAKILHADITVGLDEYNYAIHAIELILGMIDDEVRSVQYVGTAKSDTHSIDTFMVFFEGGATATYHVFLGTFTYFNVSLLTTERERADACFTVDITRLYEAMLSELCNELEGKPSLLVSLKEMIVGVRVALAAKLSKSRGGEEISIDSEDLKDVSYDGYLFEKSYSMGGKMYL